MKRNNAAAIHRCTARCVFAHARQVAAHSRSYSAQAEQVDGGADAGVGRHHAVQAAAQVVEVGVEQQVDLERQEAGDERQHHASVCDDRAPLFRHADAFLAIGHRDLPDRLSCGRLYLGGGGHMHRVSTEFGGETIDARDTGICSKSSIFCGAALAWSSQAKVGVHAA